MAGGAVPAVAASAPARVDLAGGTLDIWPLYLLVEGAVTVNAAVGLRARVEVRSGEGDHHRVVAQDLRLETRIPVAPARPAAGGPVSLGPLPLHAAVLRRLDPGGPLHLVTTSEVPAGSGLGGSSALAVGLIAAVEAAGGRRVIPEEVAALARDIEAQVIQAPTGNQDHLAALHGGVAAIAWGPGPARREALPAAPGRLEERGHLAYLGASRASARANWDMVRRALDGDAATRRGLSAVAAIAAAMREALRRGDLDEAGRLLGREWEERRGLSPEVSTPETEAALGAALRAGADGGKICGAGGGGCLFVMGPPDARMRIEGALDRAGCRRLPFSVDAAGLVVAPAGGAP